MYENLINGGVLNFFKTSIVLFLIMTISLPIIAGPLIDVLKFIKALTNILKNLKKTLGGKQ